MNRKYFALPFFCFLMILFLNGCDDSLKVEVKDKNFDFSKVKSVLVYPVEAKTYHTSDIMTNYLVFYLQINGFKVFTPENIGVNKADLVIKGKVLRYVVKKNEGWDYDPRFPDYYWRRFPPYSNPYYGQTLYLAKVGYVDLGLTLYKDKEEILYLVASKSHYERFFGNDRPTATDDKDILHNLTITIMEAIFNQMGDYSNKIQIRHVENNKVVIVPGIGSEKKLTLLVGQILTVYKEEKILCRTCPYVLGKRLVPIAEIKVTKTTPDEAEAVILKLNKGESVERFNYVL